MNCRRCGRNNPPNAKHCVYCGASLMSSNNKHKNKKQTEGVIVALIMVLILLLVVVAGIYIYKSNTSRVGGFGHGGGGSYIPHIPTQEETPMPVTDVEEQSDADEPSYTPPPSAKNEKLEKKNMFLEKADEIEEYSKNYLETAETQVEINSESDIVYKKWDELLNEVYQYLKTKMPDSDFKQIQEDEIAWIAKKEKAIEVAETEWEGGSGELMARNMVAIQYTEERCYYLISLIN